MQCFHRGISGAKGDIGKADGDMSSLIEIKPEHQERLLSPITYLIIVNLALLLFVIIGLSLDKSKKLLYKPTYKD